MRNATTVLLAVVCFVSLLAGFSQPALGDLIIVSNIQQVGSAGSRSFVTPIATSFTSGSGPGWNLDSVLVNMTNSGLPRDIVFHVYDDSGLNTPGAELLSFSATVPNTPLQTLNFTNSTPFQIAPNKTYWLGASGGVLNVTQWENTEQLGVDTLSAPDWSIGDVSLGLIGGVWEASSDRPLMFALNVSVPEPSSLAFVSVCAFGMLFRRRKR